MKTQNLAVVRPTQQVSTDPPPMPTVQIIRRHIGSYALKPLPPEEQLFSALTEVNAALGPSPDDFVEKAARAMVAAWPNSKPDAMYLAGLVSDLAEYPPDAVFRATRDLRRNSKFLPSHAEVVAALNEAVAERHKLKWDIREAIKELEQQTEERRKRDLARQQEADRIAAMEAKLAALGADAPEPGEFKLADDFLARARWGEFRKCWAIFQRWKAGLETLEPWFITMLRRAAIIAQVLHATIPVDARRAILRLLAKDEKAAREALNEAIATLQNSGFPAGVDEAQDLIVELLDADAIEVSQ